VRLTRGLIYHHLVNMAQWHINKDNYASGRAGIVEAHHRHPLAAFIPGASRAIQFCRSGLGVSGGGVT